MTTISAEPALLLEDLVRIDVTIEGAPADLFGVSFHLMTDGADFELKSYHVGTVFDKAEPIHLVHEKNGSFVTGLTLKRGDQADILDGNLITFYVRPLEEGELSFHFDYPVLSVFEGGRKDVEAVEWLDGAVYVEFEEDFSQEEIQKEEVKEAQTSVLGLDFARNEQPSDTMTPIENHIGQIYSVLFVALLVLVAFSVFYFLYFRRRRP